MRALMLRAPEDLLARRRHLGIDVFDEMWEGVLHMVPPPTNDHQRFGTRLLVVLDPRAQRRGLEISYETGVFRPGRADDYRVPDLVVAHPLDRSRRGVEGRATLVIEILPPDDESRDKLPFFAEMGISEVWLVDPETRALEVLRLAEGSYQIVPPDVDGVVRAPALDVELSIVAGPRLRVASDGESVEI